MAHFHAVLIDHAHCEKKAASHALTLISQYPEQTPIIAPLIALAQEELRHFGQVCRLLKKRAITLTVDGGDPYVKALMGLARHSRLERLVDRLLIASLVEARSAERLGLLAQGLGAEGSPDPALAPFYTRLAVTEAGHHTLFVRLAKKLAEAAEVDARLEALAHEEQHIMVAQPVAPRIH
jgi:tRNA-(ms[2]io[6]A)-hydroxylase